MSGKTARRELTLSLQAPKQAVWLRTASGDAMEVEMDVALSMPVVTRDLLHHPSGTTQAAPLQLPEQVGTGIFCLVLVYCRYHAAPGRSDKERKAYDDSFIRVDARRLCDLASAADALGIQPLVDLTSRALARMIEGKNPEDIRDMFHLPDDLTEEEKVQPIQNATYDPRIRLLNRLYARKRQEIASRKGTLEGPSAGGPPQAEDERPLEDLLSFIENGDGDSKKSPAGKKLPPGKRKKKGKVRANNSDVSADEAPGSLPAPTQQEGSQLQQQSQAELDEAITAMYLEKIALIRQAQVSTMKGSQALVEQLMAASADSPDLTVEIQNLTEHLSHGLTTTPKKGEQVRPSRPGAAAAARLLEEPSAQPLSLTAQQPVSSRQCTLTEPESVGRECPSETTSCRDDLDEEFGPGMPNGRPRERSSSCSTSSDDGEAAQESCHREDSARSDIDGPEDGAGLVLHAIRSFLQEAGLSGVLQVGWKPGLGTSRQSHLLPDDTNHKGSGEEPTQAPSASGQLDLRPTCVELHLRHGISLSLKLDKERDNCNGEL